jgi:sugar/nucleoside kinase (ribokinase family)
MTVDVITVGGCTVDIVHAADGTTRGRQLGGNAIYAAAGARVWGLRPGVVAFRGTGLPEGWTELLAALEIDTVGLIPVEVPASVTEFFYDVEGARTQRVWTPDASGRVVAYLPSDTGEPIRRLHLSPDQLPARYWEAGGAHLAPLPLAAQRAMADGLAPLGVMTLDPYPHAMADASDDDLQALLAPVTVFLPSLEEARARYPGDSAEQVLERLAALGGVTTVIKRGRHGSLVYDRRTGRRHAVPAVPLVAKDPTGAGDAFCGGVLAGLVQGKSIVDAAACGTVSASFVVEDFCLDGARNALPAERDRRLRWVAEHVQ